MPITLIAPPPTSFNAKGHIDLSNTDALARHLSQSGVTGVFLCGSTGEGMSLTVSERKEIAEAWREVAPLHGLKTFVQVGANSQRDAVDLAAHAGKLGLDAISAHAPCYFRPSSVKQLVDFFAPVAAAAPNAPFYYYDIPQLTGVDLPTAGFLKTAPEKIPNLAGVKFTNPNLAVLQECLRVQHGRYEVFFGCDEALIAGYALGCRSAIGSTYNFMAPVARQIIEAFDNGEFDLARSLQAQIVATVNILSEYGYLMAAKSVMRVFGIECGTVRQPLQELSREQEVEVLERLTSIGFPFDAPSEVARDRKAPPQAAEADVSPVSASRSSP